MIHPQLCRECNRPRMACTFAATSQPGAIRNRWKRFSTNISKFGQIRPWDSGFRRCPGLCEDVRAWIMLSKLATFVWSRSIQAWGAGRLSVAIRTAASALRLHSAIGLRIIMRARPSLIVPRAEPVYRALTRFASKMEFPISCLWTISRRPSIEKLPDCPSAHGRPITWFSIARTTLRKPFSKTRMRASQI